MTKFLRLTSYLILLPIILFITSCSDELSSDEQVITVGKHYYRNKIDVDKKIARWLVKFEKLNKRKPNLAELNNFIEETYIKPGVIINYAIEDDIENDNMVKSRLRYARADLLTKTEGLLEKNIIYANLKIAEKNDLLRINHLSNLKVKYTVFSADNRNDIETIQKIVQKDKKELIQLYDINYFQNKVKGRISINTSKSSSLSLNLTYPQIDSTLIKSNTWLDPFNIDGEWKLILISETNKTDFKLEDENARQLFEILQIRKKEIDFYKQIMEDVKYCINEEVLDSLYKKIDKYLLYNNWFNEKKYFNSELDSTLFTYGKKNITVNELLVFNSSMFFSYRIKNKQDLYDNISRFIYLQEATKYGEKIKITETSTFFSSWERYHGIQIMNIFREKMMNEIEVSKQLIDSEIKRNGFLYFPNKKIKFSYFPLNSIMEDSNSNSENITNKNYESFCISNTKQYPQKNTISLSLYSKLNSSDSTLFSSDANDIINLKELNNTQTYIKIESSINDTSSFIKQIKNIKYMLYEEKLIKENQNNYEIIINEEYLKSLL